MTLSVNEGGSVRYSIPLPALPGTGGIHPDLSLTYDSSRNNGLLGMGWTLTGLSMVERCPATLAQHGYIHGVSLDSSDQFCLDGQLLVPIAGPKGADNTIYRTENDAFSRIISVGVQGAGPAAFIVSTKAGLNIEYGVHQDARVELGLSRTVLLWAVNKITDTAGNYMTFEYDVDVVHFQLYPKKVLYTGNDAAHLTPYNEVSFHYEDRPDVVPRYLAGYSLSVTKRLNAVTVTSSGTAVQDYRLSYDFDQQSKHSKLSSVTLCGADGKCLPQDTFQWSAAAPTTFTASRGALSQRLGLREPVIVVHHNS